VIEGILQKLASALATLWLAFSVVFIALRVVPGDGLTTQLIESGADASTFATRRAALGLDQPLLAQYVETLIKLLRGDLGVSLLDGRDVAQIIGEQLAPTFSLALAAMSVAILLGFILGISAAQKGAGFALISRQIITFGLSSPIYFTGTVAIALFATRLGWFPGSGAGRFDQLILPAGVLGFHSAAALARVIESQLKHVQTTPFVRTATSKGLRQRRVLMVHALRPTLAPIITIISIEMGYLLGGAVITETLFARPGLGRVLIDAALRQDYPIVQGIVVWSAAVFITITILGDVLSACVDPRLRGSA